MIIGLGHPRCGTGFTSNLLFQNGVDVGHEQIGRDGMVSWMQVARRPSVPWGESLTDLPPGSRTFLVARSPLAALNSVATENQITRSIGFRAEVIWEHRRVDLFAQDNQTVADQFNDYFCWAVMSLAYWYDICLDEGPDAIFRIEVSEDDELLSEVVGSRVRRDGKEIRRNQFGPHKGLEWLDYPVNELARVPRVHLAKLVEIADRLGYRQDVQIMAEFL